MSEEENGSEILSFTASLVTQGEHRFYTLTMPSEILARTCFVIDRDEDPLEGFQRLLDKDRAQQIADYIDTGLGTIPTSVVLSAQTAAQFTYTSRTKTVSFHADRKAFLILDGQHRVFGFALAKSELRVPVVIYNDLSRTSESRLFIDINTKQKPVPNELLLDIRKLAEYQNDIETRLGEIFDLFAEDERSPLLGQMSPSKRKKNLISRVTFNAAVKPVLALFGDATSESIFSILAAYFSALFTETSAKSLPIVITNPVVFRGLLQVFPEVAQRVRDRHGQKYDADTFAEVIREMVRNLKTSAVKNAGSSASAYAKVFSDALKPRTIL